MPEFLEILMLLFFGISWPTNVLKSYRARTARGKSHAFFYFIIVGYLAGIASKLVNPDYMAHFSQKWYVLIFYLLNLVMVCADLGLYYRNRRLDRQSGE